MQCDKIGPRFTDRQKHRQKDEIDDRKLGSKKANEWVQTSQEFTGKKYSYSDQEDTFVQSLPSQSLICN